jgi:hypothetical protein
MRKKMSDEFTATFYFDIQDNARRSHSEFQAQLSVNYEPPKSMDECQQIANEFGLKLGAQVDVDCPGLFLVSKFPQWFISAVVATGYGRLQSGSYCVTVEIP